MPDFYVLDLGLFRSIQSTTWNRDIKNIRDIVKTAEEAFNSLDSYTLNDTFLSLRNTWNSL